MSVMTMTKVQYSMYFLLKLSVKCEQNHGLDITEKKLTVQYTGGYRSVHREIPEYTGVCLVHRGIP